MKFQLRNKVLATCVALASGSIFPVTVSAQSPGGGELMLEEVIVSARRRVESLQQVPLTVNVVTPEDLDNLNIRRFEDLQSVVAGLTLQPDSVAPNASIRGVRFDAFASGFNPTVEFYLNDAPIVSSSAMQALFDIGRIEVLRGPQGTLRGRASPSGSITIETQRPNPSELEGYVDVSFEERGGKNLRGALNVPIIEDMLALRFAGYQEKDNLNDVKTIRGGAQSEYDSAGYRVSASFLPVDDITINAMYQRIKPDQKVYNQVESANLANPALPAASRTIRAGDRLSVQDRPEDTRRDFERTGLEIEWDLDAVAINYAGSYTEQLVRRKLRDDTGDFYTPDYPEPLQDFGQALETRTRGYSHELRLTSNDPVFDLFDFVVGGLYQDNTSPSDLTNPTAVFLGPASPNTFLTVVETPIQRRGDSNEQSVFGNLTFYLGDRTELSVGARYIEYEDNGDTLVSGSSIAKNENEWDDTIYTASLKYNVSDDMMGYVSYGSSWRPGVNAIGNFSFAQTPREQSFINLDPETSDSYEIGIKSTWLDQRLRLNATAYYQEFENYPYRSGGPGIYYVSTDADGLESVEQFNFVAATPVNVQGVEVEADFQATEGLTVGALVSWSEGKLDDATIPCNDYLPADGRPDRSSTVPTVDDIRNATGGDNVAACTADFRSNYAPLWTTTLQGQYTVPMGGLEGYVRGLLTLYGDSKNDPTNALDDVDSYNILNLYLGLRNPEGQWEVMLYGKNITDTEEVLTRNANAESVDYIAVTPPTFATQSMSGVSDYRVISLTPPREFGVNLRYHF